jgi:hypothetical protein
MFNEFNFNYWHMDHGSSAQVQTSPKALINFVTLEFLGIHYSFCVLLVEFFG